MLEETNNELTLNNKIKSNPKFNINTKSKYTVMESPS